MVFGYNKDSSTSVKEESLCFTVTFPDINSVNIFNKKGSHRLELECFGYLMIPGKPMLPVKTYFFALPPGTKTISVVFKEGNSTQLQGTYNIFPVDPIVILDSSNSNEQKRLIDEWKNNYFTTYLSDQAYPEEILFVHLGIIQNQSR